MFMFPFTTLHELNLDWILSKVKILSQNTEEFNTKADYAVDTAEEAKTIAEQAAQAQIGDGAVTTPKLADEAVTTAKIDDGAITEAKLSASVKSALSKFNIYHVIPDGTGDFTTISSAVASAVDDDVIIVHNGTYTESVKANGKKISIIGVDRDSCILQYSGLDYANPPIEIAKGKVKNITIKCLNTGSQGNSNAYCAHIDNDNSANNSLIFENVYFYNPVHQGVGIGLRHNFRLSFLNCIFETVDQGALYCHDWETSDSSADKSGQVLECEYCTFLNNSATNATIMLQSQELSTNCATCKFVSCSIENLNTSGNKISMSRWQGRTLTNNSFMGSSDWVLDSSSALNTAKELKSVGYPINNKDYPIYDNIRLRTFRNETITMPIRRFQGAVAVCNLQGVGFRFLSFYHNYANSTDSVEVKDVTTGQTFTSTYFSFGVSSDSITITATPSGINMILFLAPASLW